MIYIYICMFLYITVNCVMRCYISRYYDVVVDDDDGALTHQLLSFFCCPLCCSRLEYDG